MSIGNTLGDFQDNKNKFKGSFLIILTLCLCYIGYCEDYFVR